MCAPWDTGCLVNDLATAASNTVLGQITQMIVSAEQYLIDASASWWVLLPSISLYPGANTTNPDAAPIAAVANIRALILPITAIVAMGGMLWNGLLMVLSRKPAPMVNVLRGLWNTALWSAVGIFGTNLLLYGTDQFSTYVITSALRSVGNPSFGKRLATLLIPVTGVGGLPQGLVLLVGGIALICAFIQAILMLFRDGSVLVLAATMPLAASGSFTNATGGWLRKVMAWQLALIFYKAVAAMVYASAIWLQGENTSTDPRILLMGVAMMLVSLVALPVLLRFFNWTIGSLQNGNGGLGLLAAAGAAAMHAASSLRGAGGGFDVNAHARYLSETFDRGSAGGGRPGPDPTGPTGPGPSNGPMPGPAGGLKPPAFVGEAGPGKVATITSAGGGATGAATTGGAGGAATTAAAGAAAASGPAAPVVAGVVAAVGTAVNTVTAAANAAANATSDATKGG